MEHARDQEAQGEAQSLGGAGDFVSGAAHEVTAALKQAASESAEAAMISGADRMGRLGRAVHGAANEIGRELPPVGDYIHSAAGRLDDFASGLRGKSLEDMSSSLGTFVRQEPAIAFVGLVFAGLVVSRLIRSSQ